ncbi:hypothetical protein FRX31_021526 [Thalictrum thalictroides]|uniref:Uncharacterized protein n=1 Tax=Thalictrum thalictroides TaxID=46969 RepID=A0A7J6VXG4_THATH|nr:hypothetical protein FRX31_021526 [Thalictrum thalictroides]
MSEWNSQTEHTSLLTFYLSGRDSWKIWDEAQQRHQPGRAQTLDFKALTRMCMSSFNVDNTNSYVVQTNSQSEHRETDMAADYQASTDSLSGCICLYVQRYMAATKNKMLK